MNTLGRTASRRTRAFLAHALTCVLLAGITFAATAGSVHTHGNISPGRRTGPAAEAAGEVSISADDPPHGHPHGHECLICLLQQNLSNGALYKVPSTPAPPPARPARTASSSAVYSSASNTPRRGRAPPAASLL